MLAGIYPFLSKSVSNAVGHSKLVTKEHIVDCSELDDLLNCQWDSAFDDNHDIDDSADELRGWFNNPSLGRIKNIISQDPHDPDALRSCLAALGFYLVSRVHEGQERAYYENQAAIKVLMNGHFTNSAAQEVYSHCLGTMGNEPFWFHVASTSSAGSDFGGELRGNLEWQRDNNRKSLVKALEAWREQESSPNRLKRMIAIYRLMLGQRHSDNLGVPKSYRACFRDDPDRLFATIAQVLS